MRFEEAYEGWNEGRLTQAEAAQILGMCERIFRRYSARYEVDGLEGLIDRRLEQVSTPVDEVMTLTEQYRAQHRAASLPLRCGAANSTASLKGTALKRRKTQRTIK